MIVIVGRRSRSRRNFEKLYLRSLVQDCDPGDEIAIAAALYFSRLGDRDPGEDVVIAAKL